MTTHHPGTPLRDGSGTLSVHMRTIGRVANPLTNPDPPTGPGTSGTAGDQIAQAVWEYNRQEASHNVRLPTDVIVVAGADLYWELYKQAGNDPMLRWTIAGPNHILRCLNAAVYRVDPPMVAAARGWRLLRGTELSGEVQA